MGVAAKLYMECGVCKERTSLKLEWNDFEDDGVMFFFSNQLETVSENRFEYYDEESADYWLLIGKDDKIICRCPTCRGEK